MFEHVVGHPALPRERASTRFADAGIHPSMARSRREVLEKVVKMLRLARAAGSEAEAHTALTLAQKLMYAHGLAAHEVEGSEEEVEPIEESVIDHASARLGWREYLAAVVAENFRCAYILSRPKLPAAAASSASVIRLVFVGRQHDVSAAAEAYRAVTIAGETLAEAYVAERVEAEQQAAREAYLSGFLAGLDRRFREQVTATALVVRIEDAVMAHARALTNAGDAQGVGLAIADKEALRTGYAQGFAFGDATKRIG